MNEKVFVIGSNSFSASSFIDLLLVKNYSVYGISRSNQNRSCFIHYKKNDINFKFLKLCINKNQKEIIQLIKKEKPKYIVNYAAQSMVEQSWDNAKDWFLTNSYSIPVLYNKIYDLNIIDKLIHISTPEIYGKTHKLINENNIFNPSTPYAVSRTTADLYLKILDEFKSYPYSSIRASNVYGEYQKLYRIIPKTVGYFLNKKKIELHGGGLSSRSFIHIEDVSKATYIVMTKGGNGQIYHVSGDYLITIKLLVKKIAKKLNIDFSNNIVISNDRTGKDIFYKLDSSKIKKLGWRQKIKLDEGLDRVINWYKFSESKFLKSDYNYIHKK